ncbi:MAG: hypothetical protein ABSG86_24045 [Thermoguttaceae bacterium]|jgi:hypothetical protein
MRSPAFALVGLIVLAGQLPAPAVEAVVKRVDAGRLLTVAADGQLDDFVEHDRMHESPAGQRKVGNLLLQFFKSDPTSQPWFVAHPQVASRCG